MHNIVTTQDAPPIGSHNDIYNRLIEQLPRWFGSNHPVLDTILEALINTAIFNYQQFFYAKLQMRLQTATDTNLDLISKDYLGNFLPRRQNEPDDSYRNRISVNLLQPMDTRSAMENALYLLTGYHPVIFEPWRVFDCGAYNQPSTLGYSTFGKYGSSSYAYQCFIDVYVDPYQGMANYSGYNNYYGGYNSSGGLAQLWYGGASITTAVIQDQDIYAQIERTKIQGTICWVNIIRAIPPTQ